MNRFHSNLVNRFVIDKKERKDEKQMKKLRFFILGIISFSLVVSGMQNGANKNVMAAQISDADDSVVNDTTENKTEENEQTSDTETTEGETTNNGTEAADNENKEQDNENQNVVSTINPKIKVLVDDEEVDLSQTPGILFNGVYMVPVKEVLEEKLQVVCEFQEENGKITLKKYGKTIELQLNSKDATVNGQVVQMSQGPFAGDGVNGTEKSIFVPAEFVAEQLCYEYEEIQVSDTEVEILFSSPMQISYDGKTELYLGNKVEQIVFNGEPYYFDATIPGIEINETMMVPVAEAIGDGPVDATVTVSGGSITVKRGITIKFTVNEKTAVVDGAEKEMAEAVREVTYDGNSYYMVPAEFLFKNLGMTTYSLDTVGRKITVKKSGGVGLKVSTKPANVSGNYVKKIAENTKSNKDVFTFTFAKNPGISVTSTSKQIKVTLKNIKIDKNHTEKVYDAKYTNKVTVTKSGKNLIVKIAKTKNKNFRYRYGGGKLYVEVGVTPIRIAVDCGHGANTPGKRSPKMPCNIDFEGDGKIDVKKGQSIREHQGNVGVGKYLAKELERCGFKVYRSAFGSTDVSLGGRQRFIKSNNCKYSISVHFNAAGNASSFNSASGVEVFYHSNSSRRGDSKKMAQVVLKEMIKGTKQKNRGVKSQMLALCNTKAMGTKASILVECAFMTNLHEAKTMFGNSKFWKETGKEIAKAMCEYTGTTYTKE